MKLYHGTDEDFDVFKLPTEGVNHEYFGKAIYFSTNRDTAKYYGRNVIEIDISWTVFTTSIDAHKMAMRRIDGIRDIIKVGGIIEVNNICDNTLEGLQGKCIPLYGQYDSETYPYLGGYGAFLTKPTQKKEAEKRLALLKSVGLRPFMTDNTPSYAKFCGMPRTYIVDVFDEFISLNQAEKLYAAGWDIGKTCLRTPSTATTVIFAGNHGLDVLNSAYIAANQTSDHTFS